MSDPERDSARVWRAWKTVHEMARDRGYEIAEDELNVSLDDFRLQYCDNDGRPK